MIIKCGKVPVEFDERRWVFSDTHVEDSSFEDKRTIASE